MIEDVGALVHFLPPYSPDFNPIEEMFSKVKTEMKNLEASITNHQVLLLASPQRFVKVGYSIIAYTHKTHNNC